MDEEEYTSLVAALAGVDDPRRARGRRYTWELRWTLIAAAMVSGERHGRGIGQWVQERREDLSRWLDCPRLPSEATLRRAVQAVDPGLIEQHLAEWADQVPEMATHDGLQGFALDGKEVRGSRAHGRIEHLLSLARHDGVVRRQHAVGRKTNEITAAPQLLGTCDLQGRVVTMDALLTQRRRAMQIRAQGGHYLMVVKGNQPELEQAIVTWFNGARPAVTAGREAACSVRTYEKGHGRIETRTLEASSALQAWLDWPGQQQVLRRTCRRIEVRTGTVTEQVTHAVTSLSPYGREPGNVGTPVAWALGDREQGALPSRCDFRGRRGSSAYRGDRPGAGGPAQRIAHALKDAGLAAYRRCSPTLRCQHHTSAQPRDREVTLTLQSP